MNAFRANLPKSIITTLREVINLLVKSEAPLELQPYLILDLLYLELNILRIIVQC
jgi:hypothetical protein